MEVSWAPMASLLWWGESGAEQGRSAHLDHQAQLAENLHRLGVRPAVAQAGEGQERLHLGELHAPPPDRADHPGLAQTHQRLPQAGPTQTQLLRQGQFPWQIVSGDEPMLGDIAQHRRGGTVRFLADGQALNMSDI